jgi:hypothetical protein
MTFVNVVTRAGGIAHITLRHLTSAWFLQIANNTAVDYVWRKRPPYPHNLHTTVEYGVLARIIIVLLETILVTVLLVVALIYGTWLYRQGSFPISRIRRHAKRAARKSRRIDREENKREPERDSQS